MIATIITIAAIVGLAVIALGIHNACHSCPYRHICNDLQAHDTPNLCEQNDMLQNK